MSCEFSICSDLSLYAGAQRLYESLAKSEGQPLQEINLVYAVSKEEWGQKFNQLGKLYDNLNGRNEALSPTKPGIGETKEFVTTLLDKARRWGAAADKYFQRDKPEKSGAFIKKSEDNLSAAEQHVGNAEKILAGKPMNRANLDTLHVMSVGGSGYVDQRIDLGGRASAVSSGIRHVERYADGLGSLRLPRTERLPNGGRIVDDSEVLAQTSGQPLPKPIRDGVKAAAGEARSSLEEAKRLLKQNDRNHAQPDTRGLADLSPATEAVEQAEGHLADAIKVAQGQPVLAVAAHQFHVIGEKLRDAWPGTPISAEKSLAWATGTAFTLAAIGVAVATAVLAPAAILLHLNLSQNGDQPGTS